jgi:carboxyl-terminal processing protease
MRNIKIVVFNILLGLSLFNITVIFAKADNQHEKTALSKKNLQRLTTMIADIKEYYYKPVDEAFLFDKAITGMLAGLDPHSAYLGPEDMKDLEAETFGAFGGIGVEIVPDHGAIKVISPIDDTPAYRAGVKAGDYIVQIDNKLVRDMTLRDAVGMMRGKTGSSLKLTLIRKNENKPRIVSLRREIIKIKSVKDHMLEPGYGYVRLAAFQESTEKDMVKAIKGMQTTSKGKLKGLVLDMRNNPGGLFGSAVRVADNFLDAKKLKKNGLIVYTKGQDDELQLTAKSSPGELLPNLPLVVLIDEGSASATEIVAGALQDHKRAVVVGTRSFGKGSVQILLPIDSTKAIKLTTALYYTPLGHSIQAKGIEPDINVEAMQIPKDQEAKFFPRIDEAALIDHIKNGDGSSKNKAMIERQKIVKAEHELAHKDYQLYEALHVLKGLSVMQPTKKAKA